MHFFHASLEMQSGTIPESVSSKDEEDPARKRAPINHTKFYTNCGTGTAQPYSSTDGSASASTPKKVNIDCKCIAPADDDEEQRARTLMTAPESSRSASPPT